jgi:hypothetical protein
MTSFVKSMGLNQKQKTNFKKKLSPLAHSATCRHISRRRQSPSIGNTPGLSVDLVSLPTEEAPLLESVLDLD